MYSTINNRSQQPSGQLYQVRPRFDKPRPVTKHRDILDTESLIYGSVSVEYFLQELESVSANLANLKNGHIPIHGLVKLCQMLKVHGHLLERDHSDKLDRAFAYFREASTTDSIDAIHRDHLLEVIELRGKHWRADDSMINYYKRLEAQKPANTLSFQQGLQLSASTSAVSQQGSNLANNSRDWAPGEVIKSSGKYPRPARQNGKNTYKDEIVIRNSDSGKVMGMKGKRVHAIEGMSKTTISFQTVGTNAKDRLVQIAGPDEESVNLGKQLIEETIRNNASPARELVVISSDSSFNSNDSEESGSPTLKHFPKQPAKAFIQQRRLSDSSLEDDFYHYTVTVGNRVTRLSSGDADFAQECKLALEDYFEQKLSKKTVEMPLNDANAFGDNISNNICMDGMCFVMQSTNAATPLGISVESQTSSKPNSPVIREAGDSNAGDESKPAAEPDNQIAKTEEQKEAGGDGLLQKYDRESLLFYSHSPFSAIPPPDLVNISVEYACIVKKDASSFDAQQYKN